jgi:membrane protein implicated in regulation of membrane protease activity
MYWSIAWLALFGILVVIELATLGLTTIWFAAGSLLAFLLSIADIPVFVQIIVFIVVSLALLFFTRPIAMKHLNNSRTKTNVDSLAGKIAIVTVKIDNVGASGEAELDGMTWMARTEDSTIVDKGTKVKVLRVEGAKLIVTAVI